MQLYRFLLVAGIPAIVGCAVPAALSGEMAAAQTALLDARAAGAQEDFGASMYFDLAERELTAARQRLSVGDRDSARGLILRARADAEVAATIVHEANAREAAQRTSEDADRLSAMLDTPSPTQIVVPAPGIDLSPPPATTEGAEKKAGAAKAKKGAKGAKAGAPESGAAVARKEAAK